MTDPIEDKVNRWGQGGDPKFSDINLKINHLNRWLYNDYEPGIGPGPDFIKRLSDWLENVSGDEDDQKILFELVPHMFYIGREELNVLYREAYNTIFARWLIDVSALDITIPELTGKLTEEVKHTWFCPLTDSLRINQFYHLNNIPGQHDNRPDWRSLRVFGEVEKIKAHIGKNNIKRIVLLEDFIGNGGQVSKAVNFVAEKFPEMPVLIIPLIICPAGVIQAEQFNKAHKNVVIRPVLSVPGNYFIHEVATEIEDDFFKKVNALATKTYDRVSNSSIVDDNTDPYGPFGWRRTGGVIVMHTNTPNNSLPLIHNKSATWHPLFKRHKRI
jgi:hypothetical protein